MSHRALIAEWDASGRDLIAALFYSGILKCRCSRGVPSEPSVALAHEVRSAGAIAHDAGLPVVVLHRRENQVCLQLVALKPIACWRRVAWIIQIVGLEKDN
jgi:hypothetical protein